MLKADLRIGESLVRKNIISKQEFIQAINTVKSKKNNYARLHTVLIEKFEIDRDLIFDKIAELYAFRQINLNEEGIDEARLNFIRGILYNIDEELRERLFGHKIIPFKYRSATNSVLIYVTYDPTDPKIKQLIQQVNIKQYEIAYSRMEAIDELITKVIQSKNEFLQLMEESSKSMEVLEVEDSGIDEEALDAEINRSMLTNLIEGSLLEGVRQGASDIHIVPKSPTVTDFSFRIDGKLQLWHSQTNIRPEAVSAVVKDRSQNIDRFERDIAQDGFIQRKIDNCNLRFRVSVLPIVGSEAIRKWESIVIRILDDRKVITNLNKLGVQKQALDDFKYAISQPQGMIILTGPTGSGKSTTLVAALNYVMDPTKNALTVEEPVEYLIKNARQIKLSHKLNFDQAIRAILRHDPDIVMVGEMRDITSAKIGITLANTGHLTFSTLHTNDAASAIARLYMLGIEPFLISNAINLIMAQRLVRTLCEHCKRPVRSIDHKLPLSLGFTNEEIKNNTFYEAVGCDKCYGGYRGRASIVEALPVTKEIREVIINTSDKIDEDSIRQLSLDNGMLTLRSSGRGRIIEGVTTFEEVVASTTEI